MVAIKTKEQSGDIFTKALGAKQFQYLCASWVLTIWIVQLERERWSPYLLIDRYVYLHLI